MQIGEVIFIKKNAKKIKIHILGFNQIRFNKNTFAYSLDSLRTNNILQE